LARDLRPHGPAACATDGASRPGGPAWLAWPNVQVGWPAHDAGARRLGAQHAVTMATPSMVVWTLAARWTSRRGVVCRGGPVGLGPLAGKVGYSGTHPGGEALVRAERKAAWQHVTNAEALRPARGSGGPYNTREWRGG
jgi:hypothetical protein